MPVKPSEIERIALQFRARVGLTNVIYVDGLTLLQKFKRHYKISYLGVEYLDSNAEGEYDDQQMLIRLPNSVLCKSYWGDSRARMTIAHEVSHPLLGHKGVVNRSIVKSRTEILSPLVSRQESEAKRLAAAILAPVSLVSTDMSAAEIATQFGLSTQAAEIRWAQVREYRNNNLGAPRALPPIARDLMLQFSRSNGSKTKENVYLQTACKECGKYSLIHVGVKLLCVGCDSVYDLDQPETA